MRYAASFTVHTPSTPSTRVNITPVARREEAIQRGLKRRLEQLSEERERRARAAAAADEDFSAEFLTMARQVFDMIDVDEWCVVSVRKTEWCRSHPDAIAAAVSSRVV